MTDTSNTEGNYEKSLKQLNRRRGSSKSKITRLESFISTNGNEADCLELQSRIDSIGIILQEIELLKLDYYSILKDEELEAYQSHFDEMEEQIESCKINPQHIVPTIEDNGLILWESRAILSYIVDKYAPGNPLYPKDVKERAIIDRLLYFDIGTLYKSITDYLYPTLMGQPPDSEKKEAANKAIGFLEGFLSQTSYVAGNHLTIADFSIFASLTYPLFFDFGLTAFPKVTAWMNKMKSEVPEYKELIEIPLTKMKESMKSDKQA